MPSSTQDEIPFIALCLTGVVVASIFLPYIDALKRALARCCPGSQRNHAVHIGLDSLEIVTVGSQGSGQLSRRERAGPAVLPRHHNITPSPSDRRARQHNVRDSTSSSGPNTPGAP